MPLEQFDSVWLPAPLQADIPDHEIHLWTASIQSQTGKHSEKNLSPQEQLQFQTIRHNRLRSQFLVGHAMTRQLLSRYLDIPQSRIDLQVSSTGKPHIVGTPIYFNRSHSDDIIILAISKSASVGVDVERLLPRRQIGAIVARWFDAAEIEEFRALPVERQLSFFYTRWTKKEATLKSWGLGLAQLSEFAKYEPRSWSQALAPLSGFTGFVAVADTAPRIVKHYTL